MTVPAAVLIELAQMDEYDRLLSFERVAAEYGLSVPEVEAAMAAHLGGAAGAGSTELSDTGGVMVGERVEGRDQMDDMSIYARQKTTPSTSYDDILTAERASTPTQNPAGDSAEWGATTPTPAGNAAQILPDADRYRLGYDPTAKGQQRQNMVQQAILCPACNAPLGIPTIRPIDVTCPECLTSTTFDS